jgi:hypothetical protein
VQREFPDINNKGREMIYNKTLILLEDVILSLRSQSLKHFGLPEPKHLDQITGNRDYLREISYDVDALLKTVENNVIQLTEDKKKVYFKILDSIDTDSGKVFFFRNRQNTPNKFVVDQSEKYKETRSWCRFFRDCCYIVRRR